MARAVQNCKITDDGRDAGKVFVITEMPARKAEAWAFRAFLALAKSNTQLPPGFEQLGIAGLAQLGIQALSGLSWEAAEPLLAEMLQCVQIMPDPGKPHVVRDLIDSDVEEMQTLLKLRMEIWKLHTAFLKGAGILKSKGAPAPASSLSNT